MEHFVANMFTRNVMSRITFVIIWISFMNISPNGGLPFAKISLDYMLMIFIMSICILMGSITIKISLIGCR